MTAVSRRRRALLAAPLGLAVLAGRDSSLTTPADSKDPAIAWAATSPREKAQQLDRVVDRAAFAAARDALAAA